MKIAARHPWVILLALGAMTVAAAEDVHLLHADPLEYPVAERSAGHEGTAKVRLGIDRNGKVTQAVLDTSSGFPALDEAALSAAKSWTFAPARNDAGEAIEAVVLTPVHFKLEPPPPPPNSTTATQKGIDDLLKQPCSAINDEIKAYRAASPKAPLKDMPSFKRTTDVFVNASFGSAASAGESFRKLNAMPDVYAAVAAECTAGPTLIYGDVFLKNYRSIALKP